MIPQSRERCSAEFRSRHLSPLRHGRLAKPRLSLLQRPATRDAALALRALSAILAEMSAATNSYRYLTRIDGVRGGNAIVEGTRIGVHDVIGLIVNGDGVDDVIRSFPDLKRSQVYECLAYYEDHRGEIDALVARQMVLASIT